MTISELNINLIKYSQSLFIHMTEVKKYTEAFEKGRTGKSAVHSYLYRIFHILNNKSELPLSKSSITLTLKEKELPLLLQSIELLKSLIKKIRALF
jgi:hypothetical protein